MADSASESDSSSIDGVGGPLMMPPSPVSREQLYKRIESLQQQNRVLKVELETYKLRVKSLQEDNRALRQASVNIQAKAEQEEEFISNTLLKKIQALKKEKETLAHHYEQEEECLTNDLSKKLNQLRQEKCKLEQTLEQEQECLVNKLMRKIEKLEAETNAKQSNLEQLRREKVELENTLEQEQEALVNRLWKRMDKLEAEKRNLQAKIELGMGRGEGNNQNNNETTPTSSASSTPAASSGLPPLPTSSGGQQDHQHHSNILRLRLNQLENQGGGAGTPPLRPLGRMGHSSGSGVSHEDVVTLSSNVQNLRNEVDRLKAQLNVSQQQHADKMAQFAVEERQIREENLRLQRRLQLEMERRESLCRNLSESESSLEMEDERHFHETMAAHGGPAPNVLSSANVASLMASVGNSGGGIPSGPQTVRPRHGGSSPGFVPSPGSRPISPGSSSSRDVIMSPPSPANKCHVCNGHGWLGPNAPSSSTPLVIATSSSSGHQFAQNSPPIRNSNSRERGFARPAPPQAGDNRVEPRTPGDSTMSSPAPSPGPSPLEVVMSPAAPSPSPMDTNRN